MIYQSLFSLTLKVDKLMFKHRKYVQYCYYLSGHNDCHESKFSTPILIKCNKYRFLKVVRSCLLITLIEYELNIVF